MTPSLPGGHPFFDAHGDLVGIFALQTMDEPEYGFAILGEPVARFLRGPVAEQPRFEKLDIESRGSMRSTPK